MKFIKTFENYNADSTCPSREEMISHLCACGYKKSECDMMSMDELEVCYNECGGGMTYETKKNKKVSYKKSGLKEPKKADLDKDGKLSEWELARGKAIQKSIEKNK